MKLKSTLTTMTRRKEMKRTMIEGGFPAGFVEETVDLAFQAIDKALETVSTTCDLGSQAIVSIQAQSIALQLLEIEVRHLSEAHIAAITDMSRNMSGEEPIGFVSRDPGAAK